MLLLPSSLPCVSVVWGCLVYRFPLPTIPPPLPPPSWVVHCAAVGVSGMLCPPSSQVLQPPPPPVHWYIACWFVCCWFSGCLVGCCVGWLVGCWLIGFGTAQFGWLVGWLVGWLIGLLVGWLLASCWGVCVVCVCIVCTHAVWCCCTVCLCVGLYEERLKGLGGLCTFHFGVLAAF